VRKIVLGHFGREDFPNINKSLNTRGVPDDWPSSLGTRGGHD
jgi:hypothetical protein